LETVNSPKLIVILVSVIIILTIGVSVLSISVITMSGMNNMDLEIEPEIPTNATYSVHASDEISDLDG